MSPSAVPSLDILQENSFIHLDIRDLLNLIDTQGHLADNAINYLSKLKQIDFSKRSQMAISDNHFNMLHKNCKNIVEINFNNCSWMSGSQFQQLVMNNRKYLEKITIIECKRIDYQDILALTDCMNLKEIVLQDLKCPDDDLYKLEINFYKVFTKYWDDLLKDDNKLKSKILATKFIINGSQGQIIFPFPNQVVITRDTYVVDYGNSFDFFKYCLSMIVWYIFLYFFIIQLGIKVAEWL